MAFDQGHALLIGVGTHQAAPKVVNVPLTVADAEAVADILRDPRYCGYPPDQVEVLHDQTATREGILNALDHLAKRAQPDSTVVIFYSGHGAYGSDGNYYLVSHDAQIVSARVAKDTGVSQAALLEKLKAIQSQRVLMIFNACFSGNISPTLSAEEEEDSVLPNTAADALLATGSGRVIITACRDGQRSYVGGGKLTLFAQALVDALRGAGITPRGGCINAFDLYMSVFEAVKEKVEDLGAQQEPELTVLKGVGPIAVALFRGASETNLGSAEAPTELPTEAAVRQVRPEKSQRMLQQIVNQFGGVNFGQGNQVTVNGPVVGGNQVNTGGGHYFEGPIHTEGDFVAGSKNVAGDEVHGDKYVGDQVGGDKYQIDNVTGSGIAIGRGAKAVNYGASGASATDMAATFRPLLRAVDGLPSVLRPPAMTLVENLQQEVARGNAANDTTLSALVQSLAGFDARLGTALVQVFSLPQAAVAVGPQTRSVLAQLAR